MTSFGFQVVTYWWILKLLAGSQVKFLGYVTTVVSCCIIQLFISCGSVGSSGGGLHCSWFVVSSGAEGDSWWDVYSSRRLLLERPLYLLNHLKMKLAVGMAESFCIGKIHLTTHVVLDHPCNPWGMVLFEWIQPLLKCVGEGGPDVEVGGVADLVVILGLPQIEHRSSTSVQVKELMASTVRYPVYIC